MKTRFIHSVLQLRKRLWFKPLVYCLIAVSTALFAQFADSLPFSKKLPEITSGTIETLLTIISSSMLAVATFAVGSMLSSYSSASQSATPRAFTLVLEDDVSKTALSSFIGAFIFSIVSIVALKTGFYGRGGLFVLFLLTLAIFAWVILTFVRWVDNIARLGRLGSTINKAESAARKCMEKHQKAPFMGGVQKTVTNTLVGVKIYCDEVGYVQYVNMSALQELAEEHNLRMMISAPAGHFLAPDQPIVVLDTLVEPAPEIVTEIQEALVIGVNRTFDEDPRFGLVVLAEIAARALSPAVNDPGTAIVIIGSFVRLFSRWADIAAQQDEPKIAYDRIIVPELEICELFDDAFTPIARDGAGTVEVGIRLQKAFLSIKRLDYPGMDTEARRHSKLALERARHKLPIKDDLDRVEQIASHIG
ncbi:DUF2254 domain-containing protein [Neptunicoccus sediminis]|uniref:DUF2254 domain-containing protein n=1 Tax=Neptunicoccus sediminis TaxID=1892596 RepID=UPI00084602D7|nr:DUF2254 domain-containing protein [Neptunicoccus sediminis]